MPARGRREPPTAAALVLFVVFVIEMSDVLQYVWGKLLGRHKILPTISPQQDLGGARGRRR